MTIMGGCIRCADVPNFRFSPKCRLHLVKTEFMENCEFYLFFNMFLRKKKNIVYCLYRTHEDQLLVNTAINSVWMIRAISTWLEFNVAKFSFNQVNRYLYPIKLTLWKNIIELRTGIVSDTTYSSDRSNFERASIDMWN